MLWKVLHFLLSKFYFSRLFHTERSWHISIYSGFSFCSARFSPPADEKAFSLNLFKVARNSFSGPKPPKFEHKLRRHIKSFGKIATTVVLDKDENLL